MRGLANGVRARILQASTQPAVPLEEELVPIIQYFERPLSEDLQG
jgi:hypothetical protein